MSVFVYELFNGSTYCVLITLILSTSHLFSIRTGIQEFHSFITTLLELKYMFYFTRFYQEAIAISISLILGAFRKLPLIIDRFEEFIIKRKIPEKYVSMPHCYNAQLNIKERHARTSANESKHINAKFLCTFVTLFKVISLPLKRRRTPYGFTEHHHGFLMVLCKKAMNMKNFIMTTSRIVMKTFNYLFYKFRCHRFIRIYKIVGVENLNIFI